VEMRQSIKQSVSKAFAKSNVIESGQSYQKASGNSKENLRLIQDPTPLEILQYRYHYGVNLGALFVLEKWLRPSAFAPGTTDSQSSELEALKSWTKQIGIAATRTKFEERWNSCLNNADWDWLVGTAHCKLSNIDV
jgi:hypothetical protein